jgi:hydroxymethylbilane synthase
MRKIIIGSRGSDLALWQANHVKKLLFDLKVDSEIKIIKTQGDKIQHLSFDKLEGKGFFTKEIEDALLAGEIDLAIHSHKDLPTSSPKKLVIAAVSDREDPSDLLIIRKESVDETLKFSVKKNAVVGTSSARRKSQLIGWRKDLITKDLRGNVPTRINKLKENGYDAILIATAGVERLNINLDEFHVERLAPREFVPAPAQGVLALQTREDDKDLIRQLKKLNNPEVENKIKAERRILNLLDGGCQLPLGVYCIQSEGKLKVWVSKAAAWDKEPVRLFLEGNDAEKIAQKTIEKLNSIRPKKVFITKELAEESILCNSLRGNGFEIKGESLIDISSIRFSSIPATEWIFFTSKNAVTEFFKQNPKIAKDVKLAAMGNGTAFALRSLGKKVDFTGTSGNPVKVATDFLAIAKGKSILFPQAKDSLQSIQKELKFHTKIFDLFVYKSTPKKEFTIPASDVLIFTSPSNVESFFSLKKIEKGQKVVAIGKSTAGKLKTYGLKDIVISEYPDEIGILQSIFSLN